MRRGPGLHAFLLFLPAAALLTSPLALADSGCAAPCGPASPDCVRPCLIEGLTDACRTGSGLARFSDSELDSAFGPGTRSRVERFFRERAGLGASDSIALPSASVPSRGCDAGAGHLPSASVPEYSPSYMPQESASGIPGVLETYHAAGNRSFTFLAVAHVTQNPESPSSRQTLERIRASMSASPRPGAVVIEGLPRSLGWSPCSPGVSFLLANDQDIRERYGESALAAKLALENGIPFAGGEPDDAEVQAEIARDVPGHRFSREISLSGGAHRNIAPDDYRNFMLLQILVQELGAPGSPTPARLLDRMARVPYDAWLFEGRSSVRALADLRSWYRDLNGEDLAFDDLGRLRSVTAPVRTPGDSGALRGTQRLSQFITEIRDAHLRMVIQEAMDRHGTAFVEYGAEHLTSNRPVFRADYPQVAGVLQSCRESGSVRPTNVVSPQGSSANPSAAPAKAGP